MSEFYITFRITALGTPQQNVKLERVYSTLFGKTRPMLNEARIAIPFRKELWASCANLSLLLKRRTNKMLLKRYKPK
jgi:hypothetical protein